MYILYTYVTYDCFLQSYHDINTRTCNTPMSIRTSPVIWMSDIPLPCLIQMHPSTCNILINFQTFQTANLWNVHNVWNRMTDHAWRKSDSLAKCCSYDSFVIFGRGKRRTNFTRYIFVNLLCFMVNTRTYSADLY